MENEALVKDVLSAITEKNGKRYLDCALALKLAKAHNVEPAVIGKICNSENIKISACSLGCF